MQMAGSPEGLIQRAEHEREGDVERPVKSADRVGQCAGVLRDRRGNPRVGELEQECTASTKKNRGLSMDPPGQRGWAEYPFDLPRRMRLNRLELAFEVLAAHYIALHRGADLLICGHSRGSSPEAPRTLLKRSDGAEKIDSAKLWPVDIGEIKLAVSALPEQEAGQTDLAACADDEVEVG